MQKILQHEEPPGYRKKEPQEKPVLGPFVALIHMILEADKRAPKKQRHTAKRILERYERKAIAAVERSSRRRCAVGDRARTRLWLHVTVMPSLRKRM